MIQQDDGTLAKKQPRFNFRPDFIADGVQEIDFEMLSKRGIKACMIDLDSTVVAKGMYEVSSEVKAALREAAQIMTIYIATNRLKSRDLKNLKADIGAKAVIHRHFIYGKPFKRFFNLGLREAGLRPSQVVMIGDRFIQDILGANRMGIYSLLVRKIDLPKGRADTLLSAIERHYADHLSKTYDDTTK